MAVEKVRDADAELTALLDRARNEPLILQTETEGDFAVLPLDEEIIDLLLVRSPGLIEECRQIRERMRQGAYYSHEQVLEAMRGGPESPSRDEAG